MADSVRLRLTGDRELLLERLRERLGIEKERWKADVIDTALVHTLESIEAMDDLRGEVDPKVLKRLNTPAVEAKYRTSLEVRSVGADEYRP